MLYDKRAKLCFHVEKNLVIVGISTQNKDWYSSTKTFSVLQWKKMGRGGGLGSSLQINKNYQAWKVCRIDSGKVSINIYTAGQTCTRTDMSPDQSYNFHICSWESFIFIIYAWKSFFISRYVRFTVKMSGIFIRNTEIHASFREKKTNQ